MMSFRNSSRYGLFQAFLACVVVAAMFFIGDITWEEFLQGKSMGTPKPLDLLIGLAIQTVFMGVLALILWGSTFLPGLNGAKKTCVKTHIVNEDVEVYTKRRALFYGLKMTVPVFFGAMGLMVVSSLFFHFVLGIDAQEQDMVKWFVSDAYSIPVKCCFVLMVLVEAPLLEELIFRGVIFRGLYTRIPFWAAVLISAIMFSSVHLSAPAMLPFMFLSFMFARAYRKTGSILTPMVMHCLFNAINLGMCLALSYLSSLVPELEKSING